jgi:hypothetical protein
MMFVLMAYGAGPLSLDWLIRRWFVWSAENGGQ